MTQYQQREISGNKKTITHNLCLNIPYNSKLANSYYFIRQGQYAKYIVIKIKQHRKKDFMVTYTRVMQIFGTLVNYLLYGYL